VAFGIAGGASGGDILFHEICAELGIPTRLLLALPRDPFIEESVAPAKGDWTKRFDRLALSHGSIEAPLRKPRGSPPA
jgi:hypothetical protein